MDFEFGDCVIGIRNNTNYYGYVISTAEPAVMIHYFHDLRTGYKVKVFHADKLEHSDWDNGWGKDNPEKTELLNQAIQDVKTGRIRRYIYED